MTIPIKAIAKIIFVIHPGIIFLPVNFILLSRMQQEGRIKSVGVFGCQKRYDPEKYYVYILRVERANQPDPTFLFRSYKEFCELQQKLCIHFPLAKCHR